MWPKEGRHILAQFDDDTVIVYQAYRPSIGRYAAEHGAFGGDFSYSRMSWVKPNFLWMMYRSGWGTQGRPGGHPGPAAAAGVLRLTVGPGRPVRRGTATCSPPRRSGRGRSAGRRCGCSGTRPPPVGSQVERRDHRSRALRGEVAGRRSGDRQLVERPGRVGVRGRAAGRGCYLMAGSSVP